MAFCIQYSHFKYQIMLFDLSNALISFKNTSLKFQLRNSIYLSLYTQIIFFFYIDKFREEHVEAVQQILDVLRNHKFFTNLKKYCFHKDKVCFLGYVVLAQGVKIKEKQIKIKKNWPEPMSIRDIQIFIGFANFY